MPVTRALRLGMALTPGTRPTRPLPGRIRWGNVARLAALLAAIPPAALLLLGGAHRPEHVSPRPRSSRRAPSSGSAPEVRRRPRQARRRRSERARGRRRDRVRPMRKADHGRARRPRAAAASCPRRCTARSARAERGRIRAGLATRRRRGTKNRRQLGAVRASAHASARLPSSRTRAWAGRGRLNRRCAASSSATSSVCALVLAQLGFRRPRLSPRERPTASSRCPRAGPRSSPRACAR